MSALLNTVNHLFKGLTIEYLPNMARGALVKVLAPITVQQASQFVLANVNLVDMIHPGLDKELSKLSLGQLDWLNADWLIEAIKYDKPQLASLFKSWRKGRNWLERQCDMVKDKYAS
jgi:hypothetical protein